MELELQEDDYYFPNTTTRPCQGRTRTECLGSGSAAKEFLSCGCVWCGGASSLAPAPALLLALASAALLVFAR